MALPKLNKNLLILGYKLLHDVLALLLTAFGALIVLNGILPEFFLQSSLFLKLILALLFNIVAIVYLGNSLHIDYPLAKAGKHPLVPALLVFVFLVTGNALLKLQLWQNILLTLVLLIALYQFFTLQTKTDHK